MSGFTFGNAGSNTPNSNNKPLFGATTTTAGAGPALFGTANTSTSGSSTPGNGTTLFGNTSSTPASSKPGNIFGGTQATAGVTQPSTAPTFGAAFGADAGAAKPSLFGAAGTDAAKPLLFGGGNTGAAPKTSGASGFAFGNAGSSGAATPAANKTSFLPSTTPAGPPPGANLFGGQSKQTGATPQPSFFSSKPATTSTPSTSNLFGTAGLNSTPAAQSTGSALGGGGSGSMFSIGGANKDTSADANKTTQSQASPGLFGGANQAGVSGTQGAQGTPKPSLFSVGSTTPASTPASKPPTFGFGSTTSASQTPTTTTTAKPLSFGANTPASTAAPGSMFPSSGTAAGTPGGGFNLGPKAATSTPASSSAAVSTPTTATSGPGLSAGSGDPAASGAPSTSGTTSSLFSKPNVPKPTTSAQQPTATTTAGPSGTAAADATKTGLGSSTAGPAPSAQSRLKNKSMDEIITRWAADLSKYQKEFQSQAETVARWDRALVENSDKVKQLYSKTFQAERDAAEVERQLTLMEENQAELDSYLDRYEKEIDGMMKSHGVGGRSDSLRGPDQERERTYKLAEKLQDRLNELNKDLTEMIEEINNTSQTLSKTGKPDDPLTKVVRVLNSQLSQLQLIDSGAAQLQEKISKAQKESHRVGTNGWNGLGTDPSDDFYRSFRGGRSDRFGGVS